MSVKFYRYQQSLNNKKKAIVDAFQHTGLAIFMTSITTAAGLLSFLGAGSPPVKELGVFASFGVMMSLFFTFIFLTIIGWIPLRKKDFLPRNSSVVSEAFLKFCSHLSRKYPRFVVTTALSLGAVSLFLITDLDIEQNMIESFAKNTQVR